VYMLCVNRKVCVCVCVFFYVLESCDGQHKVTLAAVIFTTRCIHLREVSSSRVVSQIETQFLNVTMGELFVLCSYVFCSCAALLKYQRCFQQSVSSTKYASSFFLFAFRL